MNSKILISFFIYVETFTFELKFINMKITANNPNRKTWLTVE